jgi:hypothetical protein
MFDSSEWLNESEMQVLDFEHDYELLVGRYVRAEETAAVPDGI